MLQLGLKKNSFFIQTAIFTTLFIQSNSKIYSQEFTTAPFLEIVRLSLINTSKEDWYNCLSFPETNYCFNEASINPDNLKVPLIGIYKTDAENYASPLVNVSIDAAGTHFSPESTDTPFSKQNEIRFYPNRIISPNQDPNASQESLETIGIHYYKMDIEPPSNNLPTYVFPIEYNLSKNHLNLSVSLYNNNKQQATRTMSIPINNDQQLSRLDRIFSNFLSSSAIQNCANDGYLIRCFNTNHQRAVMIGYGIRNIYETFPLWEGDYVFSMELMGYYTLLINNIIQLRYPTWYAINNEFVDYSLFNRLLEEDLGFTILHELNSGNEFGHTSKEILASDDDNYYYNMNHEETKIEIKSSTNNSTCNTLDFNPMDEGHFHSFKINKNQIEIITKTDQNKIVNTIGGDCLSPYPSDIHSVKINDCNITMKVKEHTVWVKYPNQTNVTCVFPIIGQDKLTSNQKLIQFNTNDAKEGNLTYLLSADKQKVTIKDQNKLKIIDKETFENSGHNFKTAPAVQTYTIN